VGGGSVSYKPGRRRHGTGLEARELHEYVGNAPDRSEVGDEHGCEVHGRAADLDATSTTRPPATAEENGTGGGGARETERRSLRDF